MLSVGIWSKLEKEREVPVYLHPLLTVVEGVGYAGDDGTVATGAVFRP